MAEIHRGEILKEAHDLTTQDRNKQYGEPSINLSLAADLKILFWSRVSRLFSSAEREAIDMVLTKLSRIGTGTYKKDNYVDGAAYLAIAGQMGSRALAESPPQTYPAPDRSLSYAATLVQVPEGMDYHDFVQEMLRFRDYHRGASATWEQIPPSEITAYANKIRRNFQDNTNDRAISGPDPR